MRPSGTEPVIRIMAEGENPDALTRMTEEIGAAMGIDPSTMVALIDELERRDLKRGLATLCVGGGMGIATIVELV